MFGKLNKIRGKLSMCSVNKKDGDPAGLLKDCIFFRNSQDIGLMLS